MGSARLLQAINISAFVPTFLAYPILSQNRILPTMEMQLIFNIFEPIYSSSYIYIIFRSDGFQSSKIQSQNLKPTLL